MARGHGIAVPACLLWSLAGCAPAVVQLEPEPASLTMVQWRGAAATVEALKQKPYLRLRQVDPVVALKARAGATAPAKQGEAAIRQVRETLAQTRDLYRKLRFDEAISSLRKARATLGQHAAEVGHYRLLSELALQLGLNHLALKDEQAARRAVVTASLHGYAGPAPGALPPEAEAFIASTRKGMEGQTRGGISIKTQPPGAVVSVDGKEMGLSPVTVQAAAGLHHLRISRVGFEGKALFQQVSSGKVEQAEIYLRVASPAVAARQLLGLHRQGGEPSVAPRSVRDLFGVDTGLVLAGSKDGKAYNHLLWTGGKHSKLKEHRCRGTAPTPLADCLGPVLYRLATGRAYQKKTIHTPVYKRWWFWALVGGGAAAVTGTTLGIYYGTRPSEHTDFFLE